MKGNPWLALAGVAAAGTVLYFVSRDDEPAALPAAGDGGFGGTLDPFDPGDAEEEEEEEPDPEPPLPDPEVPEQPKGPGGLSPGPLPEPPAQPEFEPGEPAGGWHAVLSQVIAPANVPPTTVGMAALMEVKDAAAAQAGSTWNTAVRLALVEVFPNHTWGGLLGGWQADARAYMIQQLDVVADRSHWPPGDDAKEAARKFWLKSSVAIADCQPYKLNDVTYVSCICELMFPQSNWPAAGAAGEPWEKETWIRASQKAGVV